MNPLIPYAFAFAALVLLALTWRTIRSMWRNHGSVAGMRKRQLEQAQKDELLYAQAAEYYTGLTEAARKTINRLSGPTFTPGAGTHGVHVVIKGGASTYAPHVGGCSGPLETVTGEALDWWGGALGVPRDEGLPDEVYRNELMNARDRRNAQ